MRRTIVAVLIGLCGLCAAPVMAADAARIATANTARIFSEMQELRDLRAKLQSDRKLLDGVSRERREKLDSLKAARDAFKLDTQQYREKNEELLKAAIEYESWGKINEANIQREQKLQMRRLFEKIEAAVAEVAKQKGYDLVLTDQHPDIPEDLDPMTLDQLRALINSRNVLYTTDKVDISNDVLAVLDARYRAAARSQPEPAAPAPAPIPAPAANPTTEPR